MRSASHQCVDFLSRGNAADILIHASADAIVDGAHRLMLLEASDSQGRLLKASYLKKRPHLIPTVTVWEAQLASLLRLPVQVVGLTKEDAGALPPLASSHRLLTKDSLILRHMNTLGLTALATADRDFAAVAIDVYAPTDL
jgi:predicted nucleic acid-binding protein